MRAHDVSSPADDVLGAVANLGRSAADWHEARAEVTVDGSVASAIDALHLVNFSLWHCEDWARRKELPDAAIVQAKRTIDALNARRNLLMERIDELLVALIPAHDRDDAVVEQFETPGMLIDRLSIMALRIFHTSRATGMSERMRVLETQQRDLAAVLEALLRDLFAGRRGLKVYRQFKVATYAPWDCGMWRDAGEWAAGALSASNPSD
jgi:hypothetical protein